MIWTNGELYLNLDLVGTWLAADSSSPSKPMSGQDCVDCLFPGFGKRGDVLELLIWSGDEDEERWVEFMDTWAFSLPVLRLARQGE